MRKPCAGAPWPSRAARTSHAPLAPPEQAAYPLTPRRARRSTPHQHYLAFLRPVQALHTASGISQATVPGRAASTTQILHHARRARTHAPARALIRSVFCTACQPACTHSIQHHQPACSALRPCRLAPVCTARGARVARCAHARPHERARALNRSLLHRPPACLHTQHTAPWARIRLTTQPAPHNNSLPHASPRRPALTPPAARSEKLQRAPLPTPAVSLHSETFSIHPAAAPPRAHSHRSNEDVSRSMGYRPSPRLPHAVPFLFTAISIKRKTRWRRFLAVRASGSAHACSFSAF